MGDTMADPTYKQLQSAVLKGARHTRVAGLQGLSVAITALDMARHRPVVLLARSAESADALVRDLRAVAGETDAGDILLLPLDERTPYHASSPDPLVVMRRAATLYRLAEGMPFRVLVLAPEAASTKMLGQADIAAMGDLLMEEVDIDRTALIEKLTVGGYNRVNMIEDPGTFAVRGSIIDIFWPGERLPVRIDLFGDTIDSIRTFDPSNQRAGKRLEHYQFGPAREVCLIKERTGRGKQALRDLADDIEFPTKKLRGMLEDLDNGIPFFGIEGLLPAFHETLTTPLELVRQAYGKDKVTVVLEDALTFGEHLRAHRANYDSHFETALGRGDLCFALDSFLAPPDAVMAELERHVRVDLLDFAVEGDGGPTPLEIAAPGTNRLRDEIVAETTKRDVEPADENAPSRLLLPLANKLRQARRDGIVCLLPVSTLGGTERLRELLAPHSLQVRPLKKAPDLTNPTAADALRETSVHAYTYVGTPVAPARGGALPMRGMLVIAEDEIFGKRARRTIKTGKKKGFGTSLADLAEGDFVVHVDHGVGVFQGLTRLNVRGVEQDFVLLTYAGDDKLFMPVHRINLIQRYAGGEAKAPRIDKLGGTGWQSKKKKVQAAVLAMAQDLLNLYARRELKKRTPYKAPEAAYWEFEANFPFETTPDQQKAIDDVLGDLQSERPMDRLICGDVGYGKTEVAMRAAMMAVMDGRQVGVLAPTTVLAQQHYLNFKERFEHTGAVVEVISRFQTAGEVRKVLARAKEGKVDVLIGTHRLLSTDVGFKNLGIVVVDEEQRFGVKAKEKLKKMRTEVDMLTMSATPIPRTLQMGFFGVRDLSLIETPPVDRRAIRTSITKFDDEVIREAILRELGRGGQVYFVHNRVRSIEATADYLRRVVPEARVEVAHGQMEPKQLEDVMVRFMKHEFNVLLCTTIIETGIDVPSANTMFIDHADDFGLSQLYQLRGRIGRSKERAFAYLLVPTSTEHLTPIAKKRLEILHKFSDLGAGFKVAQHDLELRGAGDLLGKSQSGHVAAVGFDLYAELLKEAVEDLKGRQHDDTPDPDVELPVRALIPDKYVVDLHERLSMYQRLAVAKDGEAVFDVIGAMGDTYGEVPPEVTALGHVMVLKMRLREMAALKLELGAPLAPKAPPKPVPTSGRGLPQKPGLRGRGRMPVRQPRRVVATKKAAAPAPKVAAENAPEPPPRVVVSLGDQTKLDPAAIMAWVAASGGQVKLTPTGKFVYAPTENEWFAHNHDVIRLCRDVLTKLAERALKKPAGDGGTSSTPAAG